MAMGKEVSIIKLEIPDKLLIKKGSSGIQNKKDTIAGCPFCSDYQIRIYTG
jgi:hypothetical protein